MSFGGTLKMSQRLFTYLSIMMGVTLLFYFGGVLGPATPNYLMLNMLLHPTEITNTILGADTSSLFALALVSFASLGLLVIGVIARQLDLAVYGPIVTFIGGNFIFDFLQVYNIVSQQNQVVAILIFGPSFILLVLTLLEFWRGRD